MARALTSHANKPRLHRLHSTAMTAKRCSLPSSFSSRTNSAEFGKITQGSRCPSSDVSEAAASVGHVGSDG